MKITINQADQDIASSGVSIIFDGVQAATLGPGESTTHETSNERCVVEAVCGSYREKMTIGIDSALLIRWALKPPRMVIEHIKI